MASLEIPFQVTLNAPQQVVFDYVSDLSKHGEWATNPLQIKADVYGPIAVGSTYKSTAKFMGKDVLAVQPVTAYEPNAQFAFVSTEGALEYTHDYKLRSGGSSTSLERMIRTTIPGPRGFVMKMIIGIAAPRINKKSVVALKSRLEK